MSTTATFDALVDTTSRLIDLMEREIGLLRAMAPGDIESLQEDKRMLSQAYLDQVRLLADDPARLATVEPVLGSELRRLARHFEAVSEANARALAAAAEANERLINAVTAAARRAQGEIGPYTRAGTLARPGDGRSAPAVLSVDRQL